MPKATLKAFVPFYKKQPARRCTVVLLSLVTGAAPAGCYGRYYICPVQHNHTSTTISTALDNFFTQNNLGEDGGLNNDWAYLDMKWFRIPFPNTESRKKALVFHDIHHLATGYQSNWQGEAEFGAWEISTGCGPYKAALLLDSGAMAVGLIFYPIKTYRAFIRGQRTRNLYLNTYTREQLMPMRIAEVQQVLGLNVIDTSPAKVSETIKFMGWVLMVALWYVPMLAMILLLVWYIG